MQYYPKYPQRNQQTLDGTWDFTWLGTTETLSKMDPEQLIYDDLAAVPGVFDTSSVALGRRGIGVYRKQVEWPEFKALRLHVGGMGLAARIWWDAKEIAIYRIPYSTIDYDFNSGKNQLHELIIAVDNTFDRELSPLFSPDFDFYAYGGIYRSIKLFEMPELYLKRVQITTLDLETGLVRLNIKLGGNVPDRLNLSIKFDKSSSYYYFEQVTGNEIILETVVPKHKIWSCEMPNLHLLSVSIDGDQIVERFGIRTVETSAQQIILNGHPVCLFGVNRHESHPQFGPVQNLHLMLEDLKLLREMHCNFIRCVHYPQDQAFLDLCDEFGILVWQESMGWNNKIESLELKDFFELQIEQTRLMVQNSINHPAIIIWGFLNECFSDQEDGRELYRTLAAIIKAEENSLIVSFASNKCENDIFLEYADVISMNLYPGWCSQISWEKTSSEQISQRIADMAAFACRNDLKDKPFLISEIGCCGIYGSHDRGFAQWTEEAHELYVKVACNEILGHGRYVGIALWQMFDTKSYTNTGRVRSKPFGMNLAGIFDAYRRPKKVFDSVKEIFQHGTPNR